MMTISLAEIKKTERSPNRWLFYLFCAAMFAIPLGTSPFTILGACILALWIFSGELFRRKESYLKETWFPPVVAMIILPWLGLLWSTDPSGLGLSYAKKTHYWLYALALASVQFRRGGRDFCIKAFLGGLLLNSFVAFLQVGGIVPRVSKWESTWYTGFYSGYNTLAILLVLGMMVASFYFRRAGEKRGKILNACLMATYFLHLMILEARGGYLTFVLVSPIMVYNILSGKRIFLVILVYGLIMGLMFSSPIVRQRVMQATESLDRVLEAGGDVARGKRYSEYLDRIYMWRWGIFLFVKHPLLGVGTGGYNGAILAEGGEKGIAHPHNNILYMAVSFGIIGLFVFGWLFWVLLTKGWRSRGEGVGFFVFSSSLVILVGGLTDTHILDAGGGFLLAVTTGLLSALKKEGQDDTHHGNLRHDMIPGALSRSNY